MTKYKIILFLNFLLLLTTNVFSQVITKGDYYVITKRTNIVKPSHLCVEVIRLGSLPTFHLKNGSTSASHTFDFTTRSGIWQKIPIGDNGIPGHAVPCMPEEDGCTCELNDTEFEISKSFSFTINNPNEDESGVINLVMDYSETIYVEIQLEWYYVNEDKPIAVP
ncbi:hypothetical protein MY04_3355 [Flammeovirga sp. MY04]|uniref:hypothetical protein n=1 Tax=Flammeovirga sp. MY04 TaxID=1191459 RepID=UPI000806125C|nr:hypothetical protein [Flammeovirga sp. MY04]ANQ50717.1 hypothetical protein MY04_3355 [Flammeovirga sp. MY04]